jgi:hypothetical protein
VERKYFQVELRDSKFSRKKEVLVNGKVIYPSKAVNGIFSHSFQLDHDLVISILQLGQSYDLRINNESFSHLQEIERTRKAYQSKVGQGSSKKIVEEKEVKQPTTTLSSTEETQVVCNTEQSQPIPQAHRSQSSKTLQFQFIQNTEDKENINTQNQKLTNNSKKLEELYNKNFNKVVRSGMSLLNIEERPSGVFPLRSPSHDPLNHQNIFKKSNSTLCENKIQDLDNLFDQMKINNDFEKQPCKIEMVKNLYQRTFSAEEGTQKNMDINENKIKEDNFYRGYLMNPYGTNMSNWQFNKNEVFNYGIEHQYKEKNHRISSLSMNSASTTTEEDSYKCFSNNNLKYPDLSDVDHRKLMPIKKPSNDLLEFSPSEKIHHTPVSNNVNKCNNESYEQVMAQLFN